MDLNLVENANELMRLISLLVIGVFGVVGTLLGKFVYDHISGNFKAVKENTDKTQQNTETLIKLTSRIESLDTHMGHFTRLKDDVDSLGSTIRKIKAHIKLPKTDMID